MPIVITWTGDRFRDAQGAEGVRGTLVIGPMAMAVIKRGDGYVDLPPGSYRVQMQHMASGAQALRILPGEERPPGIGPKAWDSLSRGRVYLHAAASPSQLEGCIAPGETQTPDGLSFSARSLWRLFVALGGWHVGRTDELIIRG